MTQRRSAAIARILATAFCLCLPALAQAAPQHDPAILRLSPSERVEQRCNARAMGDIDREHKEMHPDNLVAYAFATPRTGPASIEAPGAAVRSRGHWYHLAYKCKTSPDGMDIVSFSYNLGTVLSGDERHSSVLPQ